MGDYQGPRGHATGCSPCPLLLLNAWIYCQKDDGSLTDSHYRQEATAISAVYRHWSVGQWRV